MKPVAPLYSAEDFRLRASGERGPFEGKDYGDHRWNRDIEELFFQRELRDAAVLIPVVDHGHEASVILTKRPDTMRSHSGQVAFPGGGIDATDPTPEFAALRETQEEIGIPPQDIEVIGRMPDYITGSGYRIAPVLGIVRPDYDLVVNQVEVEAVFEVPLSFLMDPANHTVDSRVWQGRERFFYTMPFGERHIWGVTAGIIRTLYERLYA